MPNIRVFEAFEISLEIYGLTHYSYLVARELNCFAQNDAFPPGQETPVSPPPGRMRSPAGQAVREFLFPFLIPTFLTVYAVVSMNTRTRMAGLVDDTLFSLTYGVVYSFILAFPRFLWRFSLSFLFVFGASLFFLFVNLNFRFFNSWGQMDALKQWEDLFAIWSGIVTLMKPGDLFFGLLAPLGLWQLSLATSGSFVRKARRPLILLAIALFLGQYKLTAGRSGYSEQNPMFYVIRQKCFQLQLKYAGIFRNKSGPRRYKPSDFVSLNSSLYKLTTNGDFPFVKIPVDHPAPLPFAIPSKPNVVLVLMESVRAFESGSYGAHPSFTPNIDRLAREGVLFTTFYANGAQTIRGEFAIHSSYVPNMRGGKVYIDQPDLGVRTVGMTLKERGYSTHWIGSHPPTFDNKIKFHSQHGIDSFHYEFKPRHSPIGMGAADVDLMDYALEVLSKQKQPYFVNPGQKLYRFPR